MPTPNVEEEYKDETYIKGVQQINEKDMRVLRTEQFYYDLTHESYKDKKRRDNTLAEFAVFFQFFVASISIQRYEVFRSIWCNKNCHDHYFVC